MSDFRPDIWRLQAQFDTQGLTEALRNGDAGIRKRAAAALRALGATTAIPALKEVLEREQDSDTRATMLAALAALEHEKERVEDDAVTREVSVSIADQLIYQLSDPDPEKVIEAANKLGEQRNKRAVEPLVMMFNNGKVAVKVRLAVAEALLKLESAPVEVALLGALRSQKWRVRRNGAAILGQLKAEWAVEPLTVALKDENDVVRKTARAALRFINTPEARAAIASVKDAGNGEEEEETPPQTDPLDHAQPKRPTPNQTQPIGQPPTPPSKPETPAPMVQSPVQPPTPAAPDGAKKELRDWERPTQRNRPTGLAWPKKVVTSEDPTQIQTRPLDPKKAEEAENRGSPPDDN